MMIEPASFILNEEGIPVSKRYGDVYHSSSGGQAQAKHVFLAGNGLPERWQQKKRFVILETGFGLGINFLTTWQTWLKDDLPCEELVFISIEKHPFLQDDMEKMFKHFPAFACLSDELLNQWPLPSEGMHKLSFSEDRVRLILHFGDATEVLPKLDDTIDAFFLDGFSPALNPDLWSEDICQALSKLAEKGSTLATWSVAGHVRRALAKNGFVVQKNAGFGTKRQMLTGFFSPES